VKKEKKIRLGKDGDQFTYNIQLAQRTIDYSIKRGNIRNSQLLGGRLSLESIGRHSKVEMYGPVNVILRILGCAHTEKRIRIKSESFIAMRLRYTGLYDVNAKIFR